MPHNKRCFHIRTPECSPVQAPQSLTTILQQSETAAAKPTKAATLGVPSTLKVASKKSVSSATTIKTTQDTTNSRTTTTKLSDIKIKFKCFKTQFQIKRRNSLNTRPLKRAPTTVRLSNPRSKSLRSHLKDHTTCITQLSKMPRKPCLIRKRITTKRICTNRDAAQAMIITTITIPDNTPCNKANTDKLKNSHCSQNNSKFNQTTKSLKATCHLHTHTPK